MRRPIAARRTWMFVAGADEAALRAAARSGADVLIQDLEDFTPPHLMLEGRLLCQPIAQAWRDAGAIPAVRVNPLEHVGYEGISPRPCKRRSRRPCWPRPPAPSRSLPSIARSRGTSAIMAFRLN